MSSSCSIRQWLRAILTGLILIAATPHSGTRAEMPRSNPPDSRSAVTESGIPYETLREHRVGAVGLGVTNYGMLGSRGRSVTDPCSGQPARSLEFPRGSGLEYLFWSGLWVGAVKGGDTLTSVGIDGWFDIHEFHPDEFPDGQFIERTTRPILRQDPGSACPSILFSPDAISEQDLIARFDDTLISGSHGGIDPIDGRMHIPLGLHITRQTMAWSTSIARNIILVVYELENIGADPLDSVFVGLYVDPDIGHRSITDIYIDDQSGFMASAPSIIPGAPADPLALAWAADNDGDPVGGAFNSESATGAIGIRLLSGATPPDGIAFNWWVSSSDPTLDWGPNLATSTVLFPEGNLGTPGGDKAKYSVMANGEQDYDQVFSAVDYSGSGWMPPPPPAVAQDIADGADTRFLLSQGPFNLAPGETTTIPVAIVAASGFHIDPNNLASRFDPADPQPYLDALDFAGLIRHAQLAQWIYDTPGIDTDGDGYRGNFIVHHGDTSFFSGDGIPDYNAPVPPAPQVPVVQTVGDFIRLRFNGEDAESVPDRFSGAVDFEGYAVYGSTATSAPADFALLARRDLTNYTQYRWGRDANDWLDESLPFTLATLKQMWDSVSMADYGIPFHPDSFSTPDLAMSFRVITPVVTDRSRLDTNFYYFSPFGPNDTPNDDSLGYIADSLGLPVTGVIRKVYPAASPSEIRLRENGSPFRPYYEYEYQLDARTFSHAMFISITTHDQGFPPFGIEPLETPLPGFFVEIWPIACPVQLTGDVNASGEVSMADIIYLVNYVLRGGVDPEPCAAAGDVNCNGEINIVDIIYMVNYMLKAGPPPCDICTLVPDRWFCP